MGWLFLNVPAARAQFGYTSNAGGVTITNYTGPGGAVNIPATINGLPVTGIGDSAFANNHSLTSVTIPAGVTGIGQNAFSDCIGLTSVTIPPGVTNIGDSAFYFCTNLTAVAIPGSVSILANYAFAYCRRLTNATMAPGVVNLVG